MRFLDRLPSNHERSSPMSCGCYKRRIMKTLLLLVSIAVAVASGGTTSAAQPAEDVVSYARTAILETGDRPITKEINDADPEQRKRLLAAIVQITDEAFKTPEPKGYAILSLIVRSAHILEAVADDDATIAAFASHLGEVYYASLPAVIRALSRCRDPRAVDALAEYARVRLKEISSGPLEFPPTWTEEQRLTATITTADFLFALSGLAHSANPFGKAIARELRDKYIKLYEGSRLFDGRLRALAEFDIDPQLRGTAQPLISHGHTTAISSPGLPKQSSPFKSAKSEPVPQSNRMPGTSKIWMAIAAGIGGVIVLGILIRFLRRK